MGIGKFFGSLKDKAKDVTMDKVLDRMRDLKLPVSQKKINKMVDSHIANMPGVKTAKVEVTREGLTVKATFTDGQPALKQKLAFSELMWTHHKRSFVFDACEGYDCQKDAVTYSCVSVTIAAILKQMLGFTDKNITEDTFAKEIGPVSGVMEKAGKIYFDVKRIQLLKQYANYRVMGQAPMDHLNVVDCWFENSKIIVRIDNNKLVDQIKSLNMDPATMKKMMKGDMGDLTGE